MDLYNSAPEVNAALEAIGKERRMIALSASRPLLNAALENGAASISIESAVEILYKSTVTVLIHEGKLTQGSDKNPELVSSYLKEHGEMLLKLSLSVYKLCLEEVFRTESKKSDISGTMKKAMAFAAGAAIGALFS